MLSPTLYRTYDAVTLVAHSLNAAIGANVTLPASLFRSELALQRDDSEGEEGYPQAVRDTLTGANFQFSGLSADLPIMFNGRNGNRETPMQYYGVLLWTPIEGILTME